MSTFDLLAVTGLIIVNLPHDVTATAVSLAGDVSGTFNIKTVVLLTPDELDQSVRRARSAPMYSWDQYWDTPLRMYPLSFTLRFRPFEV
jgi:hypothetical protein